MLRGIRFSRFPLCLAAAAGLASGAAASLDVVLGDVHSPPHGRGPLPKEPFSSAATCYS